MRKIATLIFVVFSMVSFSQEVLLSEDVKSDTIRPTKGPNLKNYTHLFVGIGFPFVTNESVSYTIPGLSCSYDFGIRYKRKLASFLAIGTELEGTFTKFRVKQGSDKTFPDTIDYKKEEFQVNSVAASVFVRINIGRRGNHIGNYLDMGAYGAWNAQKKHRISDKNEEGEKIKTVISRLNSIEPLSYGLLARAGISRYAITARYRLSDIFKPAYAMPELPRLIVGLEMGLFK